MKRVLISVSDKNGIVEFAKNLERLGYEIISTGGTQKELEDAGVGVIGISEYTGFPECLDGRLKTLHPKIHGGILSIRGNEQHMGEMKDLDIGMIDMIVVNLYPFKQTILKEGTTLAEAIEKIDIGGPTMLRAAAKNYQDVAVVSDPEDYAGIVSELEDTREISLNTKFSLAAKVFMHTAQYDALIAEFLSKKTENDEDTDTNTYPDTLTLTYEKIQDMRYGENPHQKAAFYREIGVRKGALTNCRQLHGKELSFNNINDTHGALELAREFDDPVVVACKHSNPCGVGCGENIYEAYMRAYTADPVSVFGGIIVANREICADTAKEISKIFIEIVLAPSFSEEAFKILSKKKNIRLLTLDGIGNMQTGGTDIKKVSGGIVVQDVNTELLNEADIQYVTNRRPTQKEMEDLIFTWKIVKHTKSNGIAIGKDKQSIGIGPGQVCRIWACEQAIDHGKDKTAGAVLASDAFFPFPDCVEAAAKAGITAIIQPGGSVNDKESIEACNKYNIAMIFTQMRHFRH